MTYLKLIIRSSRYINLYKNSHISYLNYIGRDLLFDYTIVKYRSCTKGRSKVIQSFNPYSLYIHFSGHRQILELLLQSGADLKYEIPSNEYAITAPLIAAASAGDAEIVEVLLQHGANINAINNYNEYTALISAVEGGHLKVVEHLLQRGADPDIIAPYGDVFFTALHFAANFEFDANPETVYTMLRLLLLSGANIKLEELIRNHPDIHVSYAKTGLNIFQSVVRSPPEN